jgi:hypothetical protein
MLTVGVIHLTLVREHFTEAGYIGVLFFLDGLAALAAMAGIARGSLRWGWDLGLLAAGGALTMCFESRIAGVPAVLGLPAFKEGGWFEPIGVLAIIVEATFVALYLVMLTGRLSRRSGATGEQTDRVAWDSRPVQAR